MSNVLQNVGFCPAKRNLEVGKSDNMRAIASMVRKRYIHADSANTTARDLVLPPRANLEPLSHFPEVLERPIAHVQKLNQTV